MGKARGREKGSQGLRESCAGEALRLNLVFLTVRRLWGTLRGRAGPKAGVGQWGSSVDQLPPPPRAPCPRQASLGSQGLGRVSPEATQLDRKSLHRWRPERRSDTAARAQERGQSKGEGGSGAGTPACSPIRAERDVTHCPT